MSATWNATLRRGATALLALLLVGCAAPEPSSIYLHPNADIASFQRIAVLPIENLTNDQFADERVREILVVELLAQGVFEPVEIGEVNRILRAQNISTVSNLGPEQIGALGEILEVQALLFGSVMEYGQRRTGTFTAPEVSLALKLIDCETGVVVWSVSDARTGMPISTRLFGVGEQTHSQAIRKLIRQLMDELLVTAGY
jgi:curli biogenesis system outer membrane secretion channel CsgG